jgi:glutathionyl-hydroquinone reductase
MGLLVDGVWQDDVSRTKDGHFVRPAAQFRNWVTPDGSAGPSGDGGFPAESGRYHLYVSLACPWAHRTIIFRKLKALDSVVSLSIVSPNVGRDGWTFNKAEGSTGDDIYGKSKLSEIYLIANPKYSGRVSVPVLWDKKRRTIVNNESPEIIRMLNSAFNAAPTTIRKTCVLKSIASMTSSIRISTTACIVLDSPLRKKPMNKPFATCSTRSKN